MKLFLFLLFLFWLYHYWRFTGMRKYYRQMVFVMEHRNARFHTEQSAVDLACAYMQVQRYSDAYGIFAKVLNSYPRTLHSTVIHADMSFCKKPLPWSKGLSNHKMRYWHYQMLKLFGGRRKMIFSQDAFIATDNYINYNQLQ